MPCFSVISSNVFCWGALWSVSRQGTEEYLWAVGRRCSLAPTACEPRLVLYVCKGIHQDGCRSVAALASGVATVEHGMTILPGI